MSATKERMSNAAKQRRTEEMAEDCHWLLEQRVHPSWWPVKVGATSMAALEKRLRHHPDLRKALQSEMRHHTTL